MLSASLFLLGKVTEADDFYGILIFVYIVSIFYLLFFFLENFFNNPHGKVVFRKKNINVLTFLSVNAMMSRWHKLVEPKI